MEQKELIQLFTGIFDETISILNKIEKGFVGNNLKILEEGEAEFISKLKSHLPFVEKIITERDKDEVEKQYVSLILSFQATALAIENLIGKMVIRTHSKILFSDRAIKEIKTLFELVLSQMRDVRDYVVTKNSHLKQNIKATMENILKISIEYDLIHQNRLITGVCMPKASYLYIDMTDSIKRIARGLVDFAEKV